VVVDSEQELTLPGSQDLPPVTPAVAGMMCDDFEISSELPPATLLDLAARRAVRLEEVAPGKTICGSARPDPTNRSSSTSKESSTRWRGRPRSTPEPRLRVEHGRRRAYVILSSGR
jgi:hypothetical protein